MTWRPWSLALLVILTSIGGAARAQPIGTDMAPGVLPLPGSSRPGAPARRPRPSRRRGWNPPRFDRAGLPWIQLGSAPRPRPVQPLPEVPPVPAPPSRAEIPAAIVRRRWTGMSGNSRAASADSPPVGVELHGRRDWCSGIGRHRHSPRLRRDDTGRPQPTACRLCRAVVRPAAHGRHATLHERGDAHAGRELLTTVD